MISNLHLLLNIDNAYILRTNTILSMVVNMNMDSNLKAHLTHTFLKEK